MPNGLNSKFFIKIGLTFEKKIMLSICLESKKVAITGNILRFLGSKWSQIFVRETEDAADNFNVCAVFV